jgi:hypothetical protein
MAGVCQLQHAATGLTFKQEDRLGVLARVQQPWLRRPTESSASRVLRSPIRAHFEAA